MIKQTSFAVLGLVAAFVSPLGRAANTATPLCQSRETPGGARDIATALDKLRPLLSEKQRAALDRPLTETSAIQWSNLPLAIVPRAGLRLGDLDERQIAAANEVFNAALSTCGLLALQQIRQADDYLAAFDKRQIGWHGGNYFLSVLGSPSAGGPWMLQLGGHHLAYNFTFAGREPGATPMFIGSEPIRFEVRGSNVEPMEAQTSAMSRLAVAIAKRTGSRLSGTFTDVVKGVVVTGEPGKPPSGGTDTGFPHTYPTGDTDRGIKASTLPAEELELVRVAIARFAQLPDAAISGALLDAYLAPGALAETYVGFAGSPDLGTQGSYVRIDGPRVWMELVVQRAIAFPDQLHYHALWRDKRSDYGGELRR